MKTALNRKELYGRLRTKPEHLIALYQRWEISELALFGSIARDNFYSDSNVDILVTYQPTAKRGLIEKITLKEELENLLQRRVDLVSKTAIEQSRNWIRRQNFSAQPR